MKLWQSSLLSIKVYVTKERNGMQAWLNEQTGLYLGKHDQERLIEAFAGKEAPIYACDDLDTCSILSRYAYAQSIPAVMVGGSSFDLRIYLVHRALAHLNLLALGMRQLKNRSFPERVCKQLISLNWQRLRNGSPSSAHS